MSKREITICNDCVANRCDDCESIAVQPRKQSACACHRKEHTLSAAILVKDAMEIVQPDEPCEIATGVIDPTTGASNATAFNVLINGRGYRITIEAN